MLLALSSLFGENFIISSKGTNRRGIGLDATTVGVLSGTPSVVISLTLDVMICVSLGVLTDVVRDLRSDLLLVSFDALPGVSVDVAGASQLFFGMFFRISTTSGLVPIQVPLSSYILIRFSLPVGFTVYFVGFTQTPVSVRRFQRTTSNCTVSPLNRAST